MYTKRLRKGVKAIITSVKWLITLTATGGWIAVIVILVIFMTAFIISSPFAIFGGGGANGTPSTSEVIETVNSEWNNKIEQLKTNKGDVDKTVITINGAVVISARAQNWSDILSVYSVKTSTGDDLDGVAELDSKICIHK